MKNISAVRVLYIAAAIYDGVLGLLFLFQPMMIFERFEVTPPNHAGYVQFPAMLLIVFGLMFAMIAWKPEQNRNLVPYGFLLKVSYCSVVFFYWFTSGIPVIWKPFAIFDLGFMLLFLWSWKVLCGKEH